MQLNADLLRGYTEAIILSRLQHGDSYGYLINREISALTDGGCELKEATLYTAFRRLEQGGYISSYWGDEQSGARRRYYTLTGEGAARLEKERLQWEQTKTLLNHLLEGSL
ncbi:MAG: PadR family transcriptional regulator [Eubacteriales bacterium]|nr:PadR family transcriptional regulator [Eubacteriales bacterium]